MLLLGMVSIFLVAGAGQALADDQPTTLKGCMKQWREFSLTCCNLNPDFIESCLDAARDGLVVCLRDLPPGEKPGKEKCASLFNNLLATECGNSNAPCNTVLGRRKCAQAARAVYRWCLGLDPDKEIIAATARWRQYPTSVEVGKNYQLKVLTKDAAVDRVRFFVFRLDAPADAADPVFEIGSAAATPLPFGSNYVTWSLSTDTGTWPLVAGEQRVFIYARSETLTSPTAARVLDISQLIEVEIEQQ